MVDFAKVIRNISTKFYKDPSHMLLVTGTASWIFGSVSQIAAIAFNGKLSQKEKNFLIPQETYDGLANVGFFVAFTLFSKKILEKMIDSGKIVFKNKNVHQYKAPLLTIVSMITGAIGSNILTPYVRNYLGARAQHVINAKNNISEISDNVPKVKKPDNRSAVYVLPATPCHYKGTLSV